MTILIKSRSNYLQGQIYYNQKDLYLSFIEEYLRENAGTDGTSLFLHEFFVLNREIEGNITALKVEILETGISRLENFSIDPASTKFADCIENLFNECEAQTDRETKSSDDQFRGLIQRLLSEMKECVVTSNDTEVLQSVMIFFSCVSAIAPLKLESYFQPNSRPLLEKIRIGLI